MRYLFDTHVFLWWLNDNPKLSKQAREIIQNPDNVIFVSAASTWEIIIKVGLGKLSAPIHLKELMNKSDFLELPIEIKHTEKVIELENHHNDPFDRILVAQAQTESLVIITSDDKIKLYNISTFGA